MLPILESPKYSVRLPSTGKIVEYRDLYDVVRKGIPNNSSNNIIQ